MARKHTRATVTLHVEGLEARTLLSLDGWQGYALDPQHTALSPVAADGLASIHWQAPVDLAPQYSGNELLIHYGSPLVTAANTVIVPVKTGASGGFELQARSGSTGTLRWTLNSDYALMPSSGSNGYDWTPSYSPTLTPSNRLAFAGLGGTIEYSDTPDAAGPTPPAIGRLAFFGLANYNANPSAYNSTVFINTPITSDASGDLFFGFLVTGSNPLGLTSGVARIRADGTGSWTAVVAGTSQVATNSAPALSNDGSTLYVLESTGNFGSGDLVALDSSTLALKAQVTLMDPHNTANTALITNDATASPTVGPDGDVYVGVLESPFASNNDRGWLLHFSGDLSTAKIPGAFGWDDTASIVPASMVPSYHGSSTYLLMTKYNNYADKGGDGVNKIAILDPNAMAADPVTGACVMQEVLTIAGPTPDPEFDSTYPNAVREWCINSAVVDPATDSILAGSEDGTLYRWNLTTNTFTQRMTLTTGLGEAYTPTLIGVDGTVYAINDATLFAIGNAPPVANNDHYSTNENTALTIPAPGVLSNDTDPNNKPMTAVLVAGPSHGALTLNPDGSFSYTPAQNDSGPDSFTYQASDGQQLSNVATVTLTVQAPAQSLAVTGFPTTITVGAAGNLTVTADDASGNPVPDYTGTVAFTSTDPHAVLPANYTFTAADAGTHTFVVTLETPGTQSITATDTGNATVTGSEPGITVQAITNATIWSSTAAPVTPAVNDSRSVELGVKFDADVAGYITGIRFYKGSGNTGTHAGYLWSSTGTLLASATFTNETASGWQQVNFSTPVAIAAGTTYIASYLAPNGHYAYDQGYFASSGVDNGVLHALSNGAAGGNGVFLYGSGGFPSGTWGATNYWVDVVFSTSVTPAVTATTPAAGATGVSAAAPNITTTFNEPVQGNTITFVLKDSSGNTVPAAVTYNPSTTTAALTLSGALAAAMTYTATVSGAQDAAGDVMASPFSWSFTTAAAGITNATIWSNTAAPVTPAANDSRSVELGVKFDSDVAGYITGIRFYKGSGNTGTHVGYLWNSTGTLLASATFTSETASGWQQVNFSSPVAITAGTTYIASYLAPNGHYAYDQGTFTYSGVDNGVLHALSNTAASGNGVFLYGSGGFPSQSWGATNYWVDLVFSTTVAPAVAATTPAGGATGVSTTAPNITATFNEPVQGNTITFVLKDSSGNTVPAAVTYNTSTATAMLTPSSALAAATTYTATVSGAQDAAGDVMASPFSWSFTTAAAGITNATIWSNTAAPVTPAASDSRSVELGVKFDSDVAGYITGIRFYKGSGNTGTHVGYLWSGTGTLLASATFTSETASGWQQVNFSSPVAITAGTTYIASYLAPNGHYAYDQGYFASSGVDNGVLHALSNAAAGGNGVFLYGSGGFPSQSWGATNYWVDLVFSTTVTGSITGGGANRAAGAAAQSLAEIGSRGAAARGVVGVSGNGAEDNIATSVMGTVDLSGEDPALDLSVRSKSRRS